MTDDQILKKLDTIITLLAIQGKKDREKHKILRSLGITYKEISKIIGIPEGTLKTWDHSKKRKKK